MLITALADMVIWYEGNGINSDVVLAIDASASMLADDYQPSRLEVAKSTAVEVISTLDYSTKVGIVSFAGTSIIIQPLTTDKIILRDSLSKVQVINTGGTAIGEAILLSTNILSVQESNTKGKTIVLITDGQSNIGLKPEDAISYANDHGIIVNTIGIATEEGGKFADASAISQLDKTTLINIADKTGGKFYHAQNKEELELSLLNIFKSETIKKEIPARTYLLLIAVLLFFIEWILSNTKYRIMP